ncbi:site-specific integrase [Duganella sp. BJB488]|uniref:site-specific integrase n=1 Tax=unclassified Duganella TaxID=2636909 RepID=UPI000E348457|nr:MULTISPECIES: site-specific integrase [unclassified Duganella]RFP23133.1 site-specific integrase [Duganella sp. BJB489]RFP24793.1 site-specific integrase [Duganella sp. BJB488]RFP34131.1 site-specific integrase [Duganella sp. BJB480]
MATFTQLKSGKWRAQVRKSGIYRNATFQFKRDAQAWARQVEVQVEHVAANGYQPVPDDYSVGDLIDGYGQECNMGGRTKQSTHAMLKRELGTIPLKRLNSIHLRDLIDTRLQAGAGGVTIAADLSFFGAILKWGKHSRRMDLPTDLTINARRDLSARKVSTRSSERDREPTSAELENLFTYWKNNKRQVIPMATLCAFALATAMRQEEICSILWDDVDTAKRTVVIRNRKDPRKKIGNDQTVPLLPAAWAIVESMLPDRLIGRIFPYKAESVSTAFTRACTKLSIDDLHFHDLRHKATSDLFRSGLTIPQVALLTGHKTWTQLKRYTHTKPEDVHAALTVINNMGVKAA